MGLCHCLTCRKWHGAPFAALAMFDEAAVTLTGKLATFASSAESRRRFCPACGSPVCAFYAGTGEIELPLGSFDQPNLFTPSYEIWAPRREAWLGALDCIVKRYEGDRSSTERSKP